MFDYIVYAAAIIGFFVGIAFVVRAIQFMMKWFLTVVVIVAIAATIFLLGAFSDANAPEETGAKICTRAWVQGEPEDTTCDCRYESIND